MGQPGRDDKPTCSTTTTGWVARALLEAAWWYLLGVAILYALFIGFVVIVLVWVFS